MTYYIAAYKTDGVWKLITREIHVDKKYVENKMKNYKQSYETKLIELTLDD